ncbi:cobalamin biosynthesis protein [Rhodococcus sp. IEGM 1381]|uniref:cobalamin biosynthesis protein n=1 Tax=Rhodococcus sp. IEGM 1381 TaxID=3047085 RepID=UPI0024B7C0E7|nr:cobalamin biosynthesis protein [Rhodococcus sp. IEGM 1381]MDI9895171.1 cobalamin biosynthesis protein [Rhodococcus sp. IEGM 1381]
MRVVVGIGARAGVDAAEMVYAIAAVLRPDWRVEAIASIDRKADLVAAVASSMGVRAITFTAAELSVARTVTSSDRVSRAVGTGSVAEAAALLAAGSAETLVPRTVRSAITVAVAGVTGGQVLTATLSSTQSRR